MLNELIVVTVTPYSGSTTTDRNNLPSVMLQCIAGKMPNRNVIAGTVAERAGFEVDKTYLTQVRETGYDVEYGLAFNFVKVKELTSGTDITECVLKLGPPEIIVIGKPEGYEATHHRVGDAVVGQRTQRILEKKFLPAVGNTDYEHITAAEVFKGSSVTAEEERDRITGNNSSGQNVTQSN